MGGMEMWRVAVGCGKYFLETILLQKFVASQSFVPVTYNSNYIIRNCHIKICAHIVCIVIMKVDSRVHWMLSIGLSLQIHTHSLKTKPCWINTILCHLWAHTSLEVEMNILRQTSTTHDLPAVSVSHISLSLFFWLLHEFYHLWLLCMRRMWYSIRR